MDVDPPNWGADIAACRLRLAAARALAPHVELYSVGHPYDDRTLGNPDRRGDGRVLWMDFYVQLAKKQRDKALMELAAKQGILDAFVALRDHARGWTSARTAVAAMTPCMP
jgi:hypothetical protein